MSRSRTCGKPEINCIAFGKEPALLDWVLDPQLSKKTTGGEPQKHWSEEGHGPPIYMRAGVGGSPSWG